MPAGRSPWHLAATSLGPRWPSRCHTRSERGPIVRAQDSRRDSRWHAATCSRHDVAAIFHPKACSGKVGWRLTNTCRWHLEQDSCIPYLHQRLRIPKQLVLSSPLGCWDACCPAPVRLESTLSQNHLSSSRTNACPTRKACLHEARAWRLYPFSHASPAVLSRFYILRCRERR